MHDVAKYMRFLFHPTLVIRIPSLKAQTFPHRQRLELVGAVLMFNSHGIVQKRHHPMFHGRDCEHTERALFGDKSHKNDVVSFMTDVLDVEVKAEELLAGAT